MFKILTGENKQFDEVIAEAIRREVINGLLSNAPAALISMGAVLAFIWWVRK